MILKMSCIRVLGPIEELQAVLARVQDLGLVHLTEGEPGESLHPLGLTQEQRREVRFVKEAAEDAHVAIDLLDQIPKSGSPATADLTLARAALTARRVRRKLERIKRQREELEEERGLILKFRPFFATFRRIGESGLELESIRVFYLVLREGSEQALRRVRAALRETLGDGFELMSQPAESGEAAMVLAVPKEKATQAEQLLSEAGVQSLSLPDQFEGQNVGASVQRMQARLKELPAALDELEVERKRLGVEHGAKLVAIRAFLEDHLATIEAMQKAVVTKRAFILQGWIPRAAEGELRQRLQNDFGGAVEVEVLSSEEWSGESAPVVLKNPRLFQPFEAITNMMPLPRYGNIDPTPFVAVFFPMFFGITLGDIGYGAVLGIVALVLRLRSKTGTTLRSVSEIGLACASFTIIFGFLYGELFGDLGHRVGLHPILFNREEAFFPFLGLAVALGVVHIVIGLLLGAVQLFGKNKRHAIGRGLAAIMVVLIVLALMAAAELLPERFFTPLVITTLVALPVLVVAEGVLAPVELVSTLGNVLSYARIMAVGTASVMMAVVANRMVGALGSVVVGVLCALLFHLINFVLGVFSPTIHMLRLHYVEFFGKFFSPGGSRYQPFRHWSPRENAVQKRSA